MTYGDDSLTYAELNIRANRWAHRLVQLGVQPDSLVALCAGRGLPMLVGLLGILAAAPAGRWIPPWAASSWYILVIQRRCCCWRMSSPTSAGWLRGAGAGAGAATRRGKRRSAGRRVRPHRM
ncbi:AMP-binding protein [Serratia ureilytica]